MKYESKFSLGDTVWMVRTSEMRQVVRCGTCSNTGHISLEGERFVCPRCNGSCTRVKRCGEKYYVIGEPTIVGRVNIQDTEPLDYDRNESGIQITYMLHETGVGSGQIWSEGDLFATKEDAEEFCHRNNAYLPDGNERAPGLPLIDSWGLPVALPDSSATARAIVEDASR